MDEVQKKCLSQLTLVMLYSLFCPHLTMQVLVWLHLDRFRVNGFGAVQFGTSRLNFRQPHIFKHQI